MKFTLELLKLIINTAISDGKFDLSVLYDKLETHLRALETLGITSDKCAAMLFPLIESCLPEELLRVWQRTPRVSIQSSSGHTHTSDEPSMEERFLQAEVQSEQRIKLA